MKKIKFLYAIIIATVLISLLSINAFAASNPADDLNITIDDIVVIENTHGKITHDEIADKDFYEYEQTYFDVYVEYPNGDTVCEQSAFEYEGRNYYLFWDGFAEEQTYENQFSIGDHIAYARVEDVTTVGDYFDTGIRVEITYSIVENPLVSFSVDNVVDYENMDLIDCVDYSEGVTTHYSFYRWRPSNTEMVFTEGSGLSTEGYHYSEGYFTYCGRDYSP